MLNQQMKPKDFSDRVHTDRNENYAHYHSHGEPNPFGSIFFFALTFGSLFTTLNIMGVFEYLF